MYHTEVVRDGNREYEERSSSVVSRGVRRHPQKRRILRYSRKHHTGKGLSQTVIKSPQCRTFFTEKDQEDKDPSQEKRCKAGNTVKKAVNDLNKQMKNSEAIFGIHDKTNRVTIKIIDKTTKEVIKEYPPEETLDMIAKVWEIAGILVDEKL